MVAFDEEVLEGALDEVDALLDDDEVVPALLEEEDVVPALLDDVDVVVPDELVEGVLELELEVVTLPEDDEPVVFEAAAAAKELEAAAALELEAAAALELDAAAALELAVEVTLLNSPGVEASMKTVINRREMKIIEALFMMRTILRITIYYNYPRYDIYNHPHN